MQDREIKSRVSAELYRRIAKYCTLHKIDTVSDFVRQAAVKLITPDVSDEVLVFESLKQVHDKLHQVERQQDIFFSFFCRFFQHYLVYTQELPVDQRKIAAAAAMERFQKIFKIFQGNLKNTPSMFESLLADFIEVYNDKDEYPDMPLEEE